MKRLYRPVALLLSLAVSCAAQQADPNATREVLPPLVIARAVRRAQVFARAIGKPVEGPPAPRDPRSRRTLEDQCEFGWDIPDASGANSTHQTRTVGVGPRTGWVVRFTDYGGYVNVRKKRKEGQAIRVTRSQAEATMRSVVRHAGVRPGDWRISRAELRETREDPDWAIWMNHYTHGLPVEPDRMYASIDPYSGGLIAYLADDAPLAELLQAPGEVAIPEAEARAAAVQVWTQGKTVQALEVRTLYSPLWWAPVSRQVTVCRRAYRYGVLFERAEEPGRKLGGEVVLDAITGEVWRVELIGSVGGPGSGAPQYQPSVCIHTCGLLLQRPETAGLGRAVAAGRETKLTGAPAGGRRRTETVGPAAIPFVWDEPGKLLAWQNGADGWHGVRLEGDEPGRLTKWWDERAKEQAAREQ